MNGKPKINARYLRLQGEDSGADHCPVDISIQLIPISGYLMRSWYHVKKTKSKLTKYRTLLAGTELHTRGWGSNSLLDYIRNQQK